jgi:hypothetical protein
VKTTYFVEESPRTEESARLKALKKKRRLAAKKKKRSVSSKRDKPPYHNMKGEGHFCANTLA